MKCFRRFQQQAPIQILRRLPLSTGAKRSLVWLLSPRRVLAAVAIIRDDQERILVLRSTWLRAWQLPGGTVGLREAPLPALYREVAEETGRGVVSAGPPAVVMQGDPPVVVFVYRVALEPGLLRLSAEHTAWAYLPFEELPPAIRQLASDSLPLGELQSQPC